MFWKAIENAPLLNWCVPAETALSRLDSSSLHKVFQVNAFGPILVSKVWSSSALCGPKAAGASCYYFSALVLATGIYAFACQGSQGW